MNTADLFATILELFGDTNWQSQIPTTVVDSHSLMPILLNQSASVRPWEFTEIFKLTPTSGDGKAIRNTDYKLMKFDNGTEKFFNLTNNPAETNNQNLLLGTLTPTQSSNYSYLCSEMTNLVGGTSYCNPLLSVDTSTFETNEIKVFPNPFHFKINLKSYTGNENYELYSNLGQLIFKGKSIENQDFSALANGIYFLKIIDKTSTTFKLVKD